MGNSHPERRRSKRSSLSSDVASELSELKKKIDEKETVFIPLQSDIDRAIAENNRDALKLLMSEVAAHLLDIHQLKTDKLSTTNRGRVQRLLYSFELLLAKLKSVNYGTVVKKNDSKTIATSPTFYTEPDLIQFGSANNKSSEQFNAVASASESNNIDIIYESKNETPEDWFMTIESEFDVIKDQAQRPVEDVNDYYQMDKGIFYLYVKLKNLDVPEDTPLYQKKFTLIQELSKFRSELDKRSGEYEEQREISQEINTLELLLDSASANDMDSLKAKALALKRRTEQSSWTLSLSQKKIDILRQLARLGERMAYTYPSLSTSPVEHVYGNLISVQEQLASSITGAEAVTSLYNDGNVVLSIDKNKDLQHSNPNQDRKEESIYGNAETIKSTILQRTGSSVSQRGTVYVNEDVVTQNTSYENCILLHSKDGVKRDINKPPLPLPRNYEYKVISDLPKNWQRLNEIYNQEVITEPNKSEVEDIQKQAELARSMFERKIKQILLKFEESVEL